MTLVLFQDIFILYNKYINKYMIFIVTIYILNLYLIVFGTFTSWTSSKVTKYLWNITIDVCQIWHKR